jgi:hypothetical protein
MSGWLEWHGKNRIESLPKLNRSFAGKNDKTLAWQGFGSFCHFELLGTAQ